MPSVLLVETEELPSSAPETRYRWWRVPPRLTDVAPVVAAVLATALSVSAPFLALFESTTVTRARGTAMTVDASSRFVFDGWGRPMTLHSQDSIGFPFAGHGPSFGLATSVCAAVLVLAVIVRFRRARSATQRHGPAATWLGLAGGAALLSLAAAMSLTVQPGVEVHDLMARTTSLGPCVWVTAAAGVVAVGGEILGGTTARRADRDAS